MIDKKSILQNKLGTFSEKYLIMKEIGEGTVGSVFKGEEIGKPGKAIAIKIYDPDYVKNNERCNKLIEVFKEIIRVPIENMVKYYDAGIIEKFEYVYLVMEFIVGETVREYLSGDKKFGVVEVEKVTLNIAKALEQLHKRHYLHLNINSSNVIITKEDNRQVLLEIGLESILQEKNNWTSALANGPVYLSPEQVNNEQPDGRSDLFCLGILMYECLTGVAPFRGDSFSVIREEPRPIKYIPEYLSKIINKLLKKDKNERFQSAIALKKALDQKKIFEDSPPLVVTEVIKEVVDDGKVIEHVEAPKLPLTPLIKNKRVVPWLSQFRQNLEILKQFKNFDKKEVKKFIVTHITSIIVSIIAGFLLVYILRPKPLDTVEVPYIIGKDSASAIEKLENLDFTNEIDYKKDLKRIGFVIQQTPDSGSIIGRGAKIKIILGSLYDKSDYADIPKILFKDVEFAKRKLSELGFNCSIDTIPTGNYPGRVVSLSPVEGTTVLKGTTITMRVEKKIKAVPSFVIVPRLIGLTSETAITLLRNLHLIVDSTTEENPEQVNKVLYQMPEKNSKVAINSTVKIIIGRR